MAIDKEKPLVSIFCLTYNHAPYIRQCLDGFLMQKTTFAYEVIINDDASTDGTTEIIREYEEKYPDIIKPIYHEENLYSKGERGFWQKYCFPKSKGKYIALCEGDDYWTDPYKLQKQVDFLEGHLEYSMSHTSIRYFYEREKRFYDSRDIEINSLIIKRGISREYILSNYRIQTLTVVMRKDLYEKAKESDAFLFKSGYLKMGDTQLWYTLFSFGKIHFLPEVTGVYRKNDGSVTCSRGCDKIFRFALSSCELRMYLCHRDHLDKDYYRQVIRNYSQALIKYQCFNSRFKPLYPINRKDVYWLMLLKRLHVLHFLARGEIAFRQIGGRLYHMIKRRL